MILNTSLHHTTVDQLIDRIDDLVQFPNPIRKYQFLNSISYSFEYYQHLYDPNLNIHQPQFEPIAYLRIYAEMNLMDEVYWLAFLMEVVGYHPKSNWKLLSILYLNENRIPHLTWKHIQSDDEINDYLMSKLSDLKGAFLGSYYKYSVINADKIKEITHHLKRFITTAKSYDSFSEFVSELPNIFKSDLLLKIHFIYYRYACTLQHLGLGSQEEFPFHLNSQLMIKKALRHLFEEESKPDINRLHHLYYHLLDCANMPLKSLIICDALIHYYKRNLS